MVSSDLVEKAPVFMIDGLASFCLRKRDQIYASKLLITVKNVTTVWV